ncbi:MAG: 3D domain-containing protein [Anaerotignaceae bacterium]
MTKKIKVICMVFIALIMYSGTVSAYNGGRKDVKVVDLDVDEIFSVRANTVGEMLEELGIELNEGDSISKELDKEIKNNDRIEIKRAVQVVLEIDNELQMIYSSHQNVGEVLDEYDELVGDEYTLHDVKESSAVREQMTISISTRKEELVTETQEIPFETVEVETEDLFIGESRVAARGFVGEKIFTVKNTYFGGELESSEVVGIVEMVQPITEVIEIGITPIPEPEPEPEPEPSNVINGFAYSNVMKVTATAYTPYDPGCNGITATGVRAERGIIAVDPRVIPLGTEVYVQGYGYAIAADTGGAIKGNKIDICVDTKNEAYSWGRRSVEIYILE